MSTNLTHEESQTLLSEGLPYHVQGLILLIIASQYSEKMKRGDEVGLLLNGKELAPNVLLNALYEAGAIHLRYISEFLGLRVDSKGLVVSARSPTGDDLRIDDLSTAAVPISSISISEIEGSNHEWPGFSGALGRCLVASNKLVAHPTKHLVSAEHRVSGEDLAIATQGVLTFLLNKIYAPLGLADALFEKCPGLDRLVKANNDG